MPNPSNPSPPRRHTLRDLRSGNGVGGHQPKPDGEPTGPHPGRVVDRRSFNSGLEQVIATAASAGHQVFVFQLRGTVKGLQRWNDNDSIPTGAVHLAVEEAILAENPDLSLWRSENGDLAGFDIVARPAAVAERLGGRLMTALAKPLGTGGHQFIFSPRLGVCVYDPDTNRPGGSRAGDNRTDWSEAADEALEAAADTLAQTNFASPFLVHNHYVAERSARRKRIAADLPRAMADRSITVAFQPRVSATDGTVSGLEVLARWHRPDRGPVPPPEFLAVAERDGLLVDLGRRLRADAVELARSWQQSEAVDHPPLWFDIGPLELCHPEVVDSIIELVDTHRSASLGTASLGSASLGTASLGLEIADSRLLEDLIFLRIFDRLREAGIQLALDNVQPAGLSFGRLRKLPLSMVNLDGNLIRSLPSVAGNRDLVRLLCSNAAERGIAVTACGLETEEQLQVAKACGVDLVQGIGLAAVQSADDIAAHLETDGGFSVS